MLQQTPSHKPKDQEAELVAKGGSSIGLPVTPEHKGRQGSNLKNVIMGLFGAKETGTNQKSGDKKPEKTEESIHRLATQAKRLNVQSHNPPVTPNYVDDSNSNDLDDESDPNTSIKRSQKLEQGSKKINGLIQKLGTGGSNNRIEQLQQTGASLNQRIRTSFMHPEYLAHLPKFWTENDSTTCGQSSKEGQSEVLARFRQSSHHYEEQLAKDQPQNEAVAQKPTEDLIPVTPSKVNNSAQRSLDLSSYSVERLQEFQNRMMEAERERKESDRRLEEMAMQLKQAELTIQDREQRLKEKELHLEQLKLDNAANEAKAAQAEKIKQEKESLANLVELKDSVNALMKEQLEKSEMTRMRQLAELQVIKGKLRIYCRLKPVPEQEERAVVTKDRDFKELVFNLDQSKKTKPHIYHFDYVFTEQANQEDVYAQMDPFVQGTLDGNSVCIIAYGPTGSGKTHTLEGSNPDPDKVCELSGILPRSMAAIIRHIYDKNAVQTNPDEVLEMYMACLELYNDRLGDLLAKGPKSQKDPNEDEVAISTDKQGKVVLQGLTKVKIRSMQEALDIVRQSNERRQTESTAFNSKSSRSHTIYRITISRVKTPDVAIGLLNIVDLAGSEKNSMAQESTQQASASSSRDTSLGPTQGNSSKRASFMVQQKQQVQQQDKLKKIQNEANHINKSLTSLGRILRLIREQRNLGIRDRAIPYREHKLTRLLQDCIGGDAQTLLIINLNPATRHAGQTKEALLFSSSASV